MAKQEGAIHIEGCIDNIVFYRLGCNFYARMKSSLDGKRVKKDPAFKETMFYAGLLARASKIASSVYKNIICEQKKNGLYRTLTGQSIRLLKAGVCEEDVFYLLKLQYSGEWLHDRSREVNDECRISSKHVDALSPMDVAAQNKQEKDMIPEMPGPPVNCMCNDHLIYSRLNTIKHSYFEVRHISRSAYSFYVTCFKT